MRRLLLLLFFSSIFFTLTIPAVDTDFWWHLATGRWIWEHRSLPEADPFDFTSVVFGPAVQAGYQLTQYWLAQLLLFGAYLWAGLTGVVLLRAAVFTALFACLYRLLRRAGAGPLLAALLVALAVQTIVRELGYIASRPQMWSSLFFVVLLLLLEQLREGRRWAAFALPSLMLVWANLHGGYILGVIVIAVAAVAAQLARHQERRNLLLAASAAIVLTGCNPSGYDALLSYPLMRLSKSGVLLSGIFEEDSLFAYLKVSALPWARPGLTAIFLLPLLTLWPGLKSLSRERRDLLLIYLLTLGLGIKAQRYLVFLVPMSCWVTALNAVALRGRLPQRWRLWFSRLLPPRRLGVLTAAVLISLAASYVVGAAHSSVLRPSAAFRAEGQGAADYLKRSGFRGNIFNDYGLGGYLAWRLHPETKLFVYGRTAYPRLLALYDDMVNDPTKTTALASSGRVSYFYQQVLDEYAVDAVVIPAGDGRSGDVIPLTLKLASDEAWALVYAEPMALVFVRKTEALAPLAGNALPKSAVFENLIAVARAAAGTSHGRSSPVWRCSLAVASYSLGRKEEALQLLDDYLALAPHDEGARGFRKRIVREIGAATR